MGEELIGGEFVSVRRRFTHWIFWNCQDNMMYGTVKGVVGVPPTHNKEKPNV